ncbi:sigma-54-dependent Fis family transcriptional regulator [Marinobacter bohaiensis]|uniref:sigma-54-dependent Fis family transcriptional regulator n=1 Tax=Marinobacter bohaiensis TaxID=2201898 RepID=UPI001D17773E|nr:sigma-54-dependent Fis family transcriptional regulator [Marinobacter bohaiensis]
MGRMQMELHTGIDLAVELVGQRDRSTLLACATAQLERVFGLSRCWVLELDASGRTLLCPALDAELAFECDDFSHPFAHVLREGKARALSSAACARLDHAGLSRLFQASRGADSIWIQPLRSADQRTLGILVLCGVDPVWDALVAQPLFDGLLSLITLQWVAHRDRDDRLWQQRLLSRSLSSLRDNETERQKSDQLARSLVGQSRAMADLRGQVIRAAGSQLSVLVQGETGCGKDLVARGLHDFSERSDGPFVVVNCAAIPDSLLENELFGHAKGAFSGADAAKQGLLAQADGGTLFLDEIGDMPMALQSKLLRVLETRQFRPLGAREEVHSDFRLVAATHQPLQERIGDGAFRRDLFYRLSQFPLRVKPLRERPEDLEQLCRHFVRIYREREGRGPLGISSHALEHLKQYAFPGNVRELRNVIEFACVQTPAQEDIQAEDLRLDALAASEETDGELDLNDAPVPQPGVPALHDIDDLRAAAQEFEAAVISARLRQYGGNRAQAAESLGLPKRTLAHKCQKFNVSEAG